MKRLVLAALLLLAAGVALSGRNATALQSIKAYKEIVLTIQVTPSPVAYLPQTRPVLPALASDRVQVADASSYDVPMGIIPPPQVIAQATPQGRIPVSFKTIPDPTATYLHEVPHSTSTSVPYGTSLWTCPYEIYAYYTTAWKVTDWGYGTVASASGSFPIENYPTASYLMWDIPSIGNNTFAAFANSGSPGQTSFSGTAGVSQQNCINLQITVPNSLAPGFYTAVIQYNLYAN